MLVKSQVKYIQSLSQKKVRDEEGVFIVEGPKIINELLAAPSTELSQLFVTKEWIGRQDNLLKEMDKQKIFLVSQDELIRISALITPNEAVAIFKKPVFENPQSPEGRISLLLDGLQDPGNLGTIIRSADWFGISQVYCTEDCADVYSSKVVQATMGSISRVQVEYVDARTFLNRHKGLTLYAATLGGNSIYKMKKISEGIIAIGNESKGIRSSILDMASHKITIPGKGFADSLNASVAAGILLSHLT